MRCVIYLRVSTREQAEGGYSIPAQREACMKLIREKDWNLVDEYADRGESARSTARPQLQEMLSRLKKKDVDAVIVHKIDRLARNMSDHVAIKAVLTRTGAQLVSVVENIEDSASGRFVEGIHALMAEFYSANLSAEVKKGLLQKAKSGGMVTRAPVGYRNVRNTIEGTSIAKVVIDEDMAPLVKECFNLYATGNYSLAEIQKIMAKKGLRNNFSKKRPAPEFCKSSIASLLQNRFYTGVVSYRKVEYPGLHEPIVEQSLFNRVQQALRSRDQAGERKRKHPHYLKGTIYCAECGSRLSFLLAKGKYPYFYCLGQKRHNGCSQKYVDALWVEKKIENLYKDIQLPPETVQELKEKLEEEIVNQQASSILQRKRLTKTIDELTDKRYKLVEAYYHGAIAIDILKGEQERLVSEIGDCEEKLKVIDGKHENVQELLERAIDLAGNCHEAYLLAQPDNRRLLNQTFFDKIFVGDIEEKLKDPEYSDLFHELFSGDSLNKSSLVGVGGFEPPTSRSRTVRSTKLSHTPIRQEVHA